MVVTLETKFVIGYKSKAENLRKVLEGIPDDADISVHVSPKDRPWESTVTTITFRWQEIR